MGRLTSATNPESGLTSYTYDNNGNLASSKDAGGAVRCNGAVDGSGNCTAAYDGLNRPAGRTYSPAGTPAVTYTYDDPAVPNSFGRLTATSTAASTTYILAYDALGRVKQSKQKTGTTPYPFSYSYNLTGELETETYPSGRTVTTCYDSGGRVATVSGQATSTSPAVPYATVNTYAPHGGITQMKLGNNLYEGASYNLRLQPSSMTLGTSAGASDLWSIANDYGISLNNANLLSQAITAPAMTGTLKQYFTYDPLNRLQVVVENPAAANVASPLCPDTSSQWCQQFSYDLFGNRTVAQSSNIGAVGQPANFNPANNRITDSGYGYDAVGNLNLAPMGSTFAYDAENRLAVSCPNDPTPSNCVNTAANGRTHYGYDGDGKRVTKRTADGTVTTFVFDAMGGLAAEYSSSPVTPAVAGTIYLTTDHLGSTRMVTDSSATPVAVARHDYRPFGEEISFNAANPRHGVQGYAQDAGVRQEFTSKERDAETGLDFFGARYMSSALGRWTSPDPSNLGVDFYLPQTWNRYNYVLNNPMAIADKNGLWPFYVHQNIIDEAFPGMSKKDLQTLKDASWNMDYAPGQQDPSKSYMHGMSDGGGTSFWGGGNEQHDRIEADKYIDQQTEAAQKAQADWIAQGHTGLSPKALTAFGNALHTVTDRTSPAHQGEQPWANKPWWHYKTVGHFLGEAWRSSNQVQSSDNAARSLFLTTFGSSFDWVFFQNPCARTSATDSQGNSTGWSGCQ